MPKSSSFLSSPLPIAYCLLPLLLLLTGCVERRIRVTSSPAGARVWINDQQVGTTPLETRFTFYGGYDVRVELEGYNPINELRQAKAPLYEYPGPDLIATALPFKLKPLIEWHFDLTQVEETTNPEAARENLLNRAESLRQQALSK
jgi:PEGA domain-containing protein